MEESDYGAAVLSETARRAWAVEQAVAVYGATSRSGTLPSESVIEIADGFVNYLSVPQRSVDQKLLAAAREYDGRSSPGPLIGMLADALERIGRGG